MGFQKLCLWLGCLIQPKWSFANLKIIYFSGALRLTRPVFGPKHFLVKIQMKVFTVRNFLSAKHWAYVDIDVSDYEFWEDTTAQAICINDKLTGH